VYTSARPSKRQSEILHVFGDLLFRMHEELTQKPVVDSGLKLRHRPHADKRALSVYLF
jgi:hypothetical protein